MLQVETDPVRIARSPAPTRSRSLLRIAALLATLGLAGPAFAQVMTITGATPSTYSGPGQTITFHVSLGGSNAVTNTVELTRIAYGTTGPINCVGLPLDPLESTTCSFTYVTQAGDVFGLNQSGTFRVTTLNAPRTRNIANAFRVAYVPVPPTASITAATSSVNEDGAPSLSYTVTLSDPAAAPISVNFSLGGSATAGVDYAASANPLVIATGSTTGTITIDPTGDAIVEADETVDISLVAGSGYTVGAPSSATGTITNDDVAPVVTSIAPNTGSTAGGTLVMITGIGFTGATAVKFGAASASSVVVNNATMITAIAPAGSAGSVDVTVTTAGGTSAANAQSGFTYVVPPPVAGAASATVGYGSTANPITLNISGGTPASVAIATAATHGTATASGTSITYTPEVGYAGSDSFTYTATNAGGTSAPAAVTLTVGIPAIQITATQPLSASVGNAYTQTFNVSGGAAPYTGYNVTGLPAGLSVTGTTATSVTLAGTPTAVGSFNLGVSATDSSNGIGPFTGTQAFTLTVDIPTLALTPAAGAWLLAYGVPYSQSFIASGGTGPYSYLQVAGSLPAGLSFSSTGLLSGTPTVPGNYSLTIRAIDSTTGSGAPYVIDSHYTLVVAAPAISIDPPTLPNGIAGTAYSADLSASGGVAPYSYSLLSGALPTGMTFSSAGRLSGVPRSDGNFSVTVQAADANGLTASRVFSFLIDPAMPVITPTTLPTGTTNIAYSQTLSTSGGIAPYSYSIVSGNLPIGLSFSSTGVLSGTPTTAGSYTSTIRSTDDAGYTVDTVYTIAIDAPAIVIDPSVLPDGNVGMAYNTNLSASGGAAPYSYSLLSGALPIGMTFSSAGQFAGVPRSDGNFSLTVRATDDNGNTGTQVFTFNIAAPTLAITPATLPAGTTNIAYSQTLSTTGGIAPYSYSIVSGNLPIGLSFSSAGVLSGTPTTAGSYTSTIRSTDAAGYTVDTVYTIAIDAPAIVIDPAALGAAVVGDAYTATLTADGGAAPYAFALESGALPPGISLDNAGGLSGTPSASGTFNFGVRATDSNGNSGTATYALVVTPRTLVLAPASLVAATAGTAYTATVSASGGIAPYSYALTGGALPTGLTFANGTLSGTPTVSGSFTFDISASDSGGGTPATTTRSYTLVIAAATLSLDPGTLPGGIAGTAYSQGISASGGIAPYSYALASGALPAGLTFANGTLSGTPTVSGSFTFDITASDSTGGTAASVTRNFTLAIAAPVITITPATLPDGVRGSVYNQVLSASGGTAAYAFALGGGALPAGIRLAGDGTLAGTPTADGSFNFTVIATDALGFTGNATYAWTVTRAAPTVVDDVAATLEGTAIRIAATSNDTGSIDSIAIAAAPGHGTATVEGLEIAYTPEAGFTGTDSFRYTATGPGGTSAPATVAVTVNPLPVAVSRKLTANAGVAVEVDLTEGATGGPFTAATIMSLSPANAGTTSVARVGSGDAARYVLTYTPAAAFSGLATLRFTLGNAYATSAEATLEFDVTARADPSQDPEVRALLAAQAAATRRFATAQINNFQQRLENMHGQGDSRFSNQVSFSADSDRECENQVGRIPGRSCEHQARNDEVAHAAAAPAEAGNPQGAAFGTWIGGVIRSGNHDGRGGNAGIDFESDGLSVGADYRLNRKFAFGGGLGWGRDDSDVGEHGSRSEGKAYTAALYASFHPDDRLFVDGLMGYQNLSYDLRRYVTSNGALVQGARDGSQWFASLSAGADIRRGERLQLTPYARLDLARATLDAYTEHGDPLYSLRYADMDVDTTTGNLGLRVDYRRELSWGLFSPQLRLEYQHDFQGNGDATMGYADQLSGPFYRTGLEVFDRNRFVIGLGAQLSTDGGLSTRIEYRGMVGNSDESDHGLMLNIEKRY